MSMYRSLGIALLAAVVSAGCATTDSSRPTSLQTAQSPVWSAKAMPDEMIVSVSPAGKTLRLAGSAGILLGTGTDAVVNAKFRGPIREALKDYNAAEVFAGIIESHLKAAAQKEVPRVAPLRSSAGTNSRQDAVEARYASLSKDGHDMLLDVVMTFGIYGSDGTLATKLDCKLVLLPEGKDLWDDVLIVTNEPALANAKLGNPTKRGGYNITNPEFTVDEEKVSRWTADGGAILRERFEKAANDAASALLCALGLEDNAAGHFALGELAMNRKDFDEAAQHFKRAVELDPTNVAIRNSYSVNLAHNDQVDDAIAIARAITETAPDYGPAWFNLAYWYAKEKKDAASAQAAYEKARALGMPEDGGIEKAIKKSK